MYCLYKCDIFVSLFYLNAINCHLPCFLSGQECSKQGIIVKVIEDINCDMPIDYISQESFDNIFHMWYSNYIYPQLWPVEFSSSREWMDFGIQDIY